MSEFFHNLSMQALRKSHNKIVIKFDATNILNKSLKGLLTAENLTFDTSRIKKITAIFDQLFFESEETDNKRIENSIVSNILNDKKMGFPAYTDI